MSEIFSEIEIIKIVEIFYSSLYTQSASPGEDQGELGPISTRVVSEDIENIEETELRAALTY